MVLSSCNLFHRHKAGVVAELGTHRLLRSELEEVTVGLSAEDSARVANNFIRQWAGDILLYEAATDHSDSRIEGMVEDYRRSLYVHRYQQQYIAQRMPALVPDTVIAAFYDSHRDQLVLSETVVRGLMLVIPNAAPETSKLHRWLDYPEDHLEEIEKYAYANATGYELFLDHWLSANQLLLRMPFEENTLRRQLRQQPLVEIQDSVSTYILRTTERAFPGEVMPFDYARGEIERIILSQRQVEYLSRQREQLCHEAILLNKLRIYEE